MVLDPTTVIGRSMEVVTVAIVTVSIFSNSFESAFADVYYTPLWAFNSVLEAYFLLEVWARARIVAPTEAPRPEARFRRAWHSYKRYDIHLPLPRPLVGYPGLVVLLALPWKERKSEGDAIPDSKLTVDHL